MEVEQPKPPPNSAMTFDEVSMERSKSFVKALQELKNLRPQLYSAAEYCEKSYLHSEQKQMVLENLKDYAVRALVNAVDHLGTVAYKLTDLVGQQNLDVSTMELKITCINQQLLTCQAYTEKEGFRQQQLLAIIPRHHKHYTLPNSVNKKVHFSPHIQMDHRQHIQPRGRIFPSGPAAAKTLSWHLASETTSTLKGASCGFVSADDIKNSGRTSGAFNLLDAAEVGNRTKASPAWSKPPSVGPGSSIATHTLGVMRDALDGSKPMTPYRSFDNPPPPRRETTHVPTRSKSMLSAFFVKQKTPKVNRDRQS
ncbi:protein ABIL1 [Ipomoea triloba]|uniref:protein ABIL1 n=1 Tax=Ipomoea triloba TaxID=35885 RepID=UPI00125DA322|nr:protein ABIL1 [Ipomoea triloba]